MPAKTTAKRTTTPKEPNDSADQQKADVTGAAEPAAPEDTEPTLEEYEAHRLEVIARLPEEKDRPQNIYARLAQINGLIGMIRKTGYNDFHRYKYAKESDLVEEIRPMLSEYGIWIEQGLYGDAELGFIPHQRLVQSKKDSRTGNVSEQTTLTAITKRFRFVWFDGTELQKTEWEPFMGYGDDTGDKGYYKAETGAVKYFLMKTFMVATGDDPEADRRADARAAARDADSGTGPVRVEGQRGRAPAAPGGRQNQTSAPQLRQIGELLRALGIRSPMDAIKKLEEITGDTVEIKDPEEMSEALAQYTAALPGPKAGAIVAKLREEVKAKQDAEEVPANEAKPEESKPAAAGFTDDEAAPVGDPKVWSEGQTEEGDDSAAAPAEDGGDDGTIGADIA